MRLEALTGTAPLTLGLDLTLQLRSTTTSNLDFLGAGSARHELRVVYLYR